MAQAGIPRRRAAGGWSLGLLQWCLGWWRLLDFGAQMMVLALSPSSYRPDRRPQLLRQLHDASLPLLPAFLTISALLSLVIIRIVVATAASYGLSRYALDVLVRTLVLELLPLLVALFVAVRYTLPGAEYVARLRAPGRQHGPWRAGRDPAREELLPRVLGGVFAVALLATLGCLVALLLTYLSVYGFTLWGFDAYTRTVGQVFNPAVTLIFAFKAVFFALTVAVVPIAPDQLHAGGAEQRRRDLVGLLGRVFALILLGEVLSLVGNYY